MATMEPTDELLAARDLIAASPRLQAMTHQLILRNGGIVVEVCGSYFEANAWRAAIHGRILASRMDSHGVRRQDVIGLHVVVHVTEWPDHLRPEWACPAPTSPIHAPRD